MKKDYKVYFADILAAAKDIEEFIDGMDFREFLKDEKTMSAVVRKFEIIGEAAKRIPVEIQLKHPEIPWKEMARMRDRLIHLYKEVDYDIVWKAASVSLPEVQKSITKKLKKLKNRRLEQ